MVPGSSSRLTPLSGAWELLGTALFEVRDIFLPMSWRTQATVLAALAVLVFVYGLFIGDWWTALTSGTCAVFFGLEVMGVKTLGRIPRAIRRLREVQRRR